MKHNHRLKLILFIWWETEYLWVLWILRLFGSYYCTLAQTQNRVLIIKIIVTIIIIKIIVTIITIIALKYVPL